MARQRLVGALGLALVASVFSAPRESAAAGDATSAFLSVDFDQACGGVAPANPAPTAVDPAAVAKLLHGVWVGKRTPRNGPNPGANYAVIYDMDEREALVLEERGDAVKANAFAERYPQFKVAADTPRLTYFYCGAPGFEKAAVDGGGTGKFGAFRDDFYKVSDTPRLDALQDVMRVKVGGTHLGEAWVRLQQANYFKRERPALLNAFFATVSLVADRGLSKDGPAGVRLDLVGQHRGSPAKLTDGQPVPGVESGLFRGVSAAGGQRFLVSMVGDEGMAVLCFCGIPREKAPGLPPHTTFMYTKVVLGPLP